MKITLNHNRFSKALGYASRAVSAKPNIPVLSNVLLDTTKTSLKISATNLDMGINMWIPGQVDEEGKVTVNAKYISDFVSASTGVGENVEMELKDNNVNVKTEKSKANFTIIPADEFPVLPAVTENPIFEISTIEFLKSIDKVSFACSTDMSAGRIQQSGVLFEINKENKEINFVGVDGFRLSKRVAQVSNLSDDIKKEEIIVPARYLNELTKIIADYPEVETLQVFLSDSNSQIIFKFDDIEFSIRLLEGPYPDYKRILPAEKVYSFEVSKNELVNSIKIANSFARGNLGNKTLFDFDLETSKVTFRSSVSEVGDGETEVVVSNPDGSTDLKTAYTLRFLQDLVNHIEGDSLIYETKGPLAPSVFRDKNDSQFMHLIMPMRREV
jgi:DNA polymerase-3 subunit beta